MPSCDHKRVERARAKRVLAIQSRRQLQCFRHLPRRVCEAAREILCGRAHQRLADVQMQLHRLEAILPLRLELKDVAADFVGEARAFEFLRSRLQRIGQFR